MHNYEVEPATTDYRTEDLEDAAEWPSFSSIKIIRTGKSGLRICMERKVREEKLSRLKASLETSGEELDAIRQQHETAKRSGDRAAQNLALVALAEHLERQRLINRHIDILNDEANPIKTKVDTYN